MNSRQTIAIDIDDVTANTLDTIRLWANEQTGASLVHKQYYTNDDYWTYYKSIWARHGLADKIHFGLFLELMEQDQSSVLPEEGAYDAIKALKTKFDIVFITSRPLSQKDETRRWLNEHIDSDSPLYMAANPVLQQNLQSKGELCAELGVSVLIDDNIANCQSAMEYAVEAILFGDYGWNEHAPKDMTRCLNWAEVTDRLLHE